MREDMEITELSVELLDQVSGGQGGMIDPDGRDSSGDQGGAIDPDGRA